MVHDEGAFLSQEMSDVLWGRMAFCCGLGLHGDRVQHEELQDTDSSHSFRFHLFCGDELRNLSLTAGLHHPGD